MAKHVTVRATNFMSKMELVRYESEMFLIELKLRDMAAAPAFKCTYTGTIPECECTHFTHLIRLPLIDDHHAGWGWPQAGVPIELCLDRGDDIMQENEFEFPDLYEGEGWQS